MRSAMDIYVEAFTRRNEAPGEGIVDLVRATIHAIARLYQWAQTERRKPAWIRKLDRLNDHYLRDIGLARHEIPAHVERHLASHAASFQGPSLVRRADRAIRAVQRRLQARQDARVTARQLRGLDDRQLADIGLQAGNIEWFVRDLALRSLAASGAANDNRDRAAA